MCQETEEEDFTAATAAVHYLSRTKEQTDIWEIYSISRHFHITFACKEKRTQNDIVEHPIELNLSHAQKKRK
jgi:hypothetical protein